MLNHESRMIYSIGIGQTGTIICKSESFGLQIIKFFESISKKYVQVVHNID